MPNVEIDGMYIVYTYMYLFKTAGYFECEFIKKPPKLLGLSHLSLSYVILGQHSPRLAADLIVTLALVVL